MDRIKATAGLIVAVNRYRKNEIEDHVLVSLVCNYFDEIKSEFLTEADCRFLLYVANLAGVPQYYDLLGRFNTESSIEQIDVSTLSSMLHEATLHTDYDSKVHRFQMSVLRLFTIGVINRFFLSASTSFGKTHLVYEVIRKMEYKNVVLIFPTIALLSENLEKLIYDNRYSYFKERYAIHTLSDVGELKENNIFIFTPERFLSFMEKLPNAIQFDFAFVDEIYKIDSEYDIEEESKEDERDTAYRLSVFYCLLRNCDVLLAGPYIEFDNPGRNGYNASFHDFLRVNDIALIDFNRYEIVQKAYYDIKQAKTYHIDDTLTFDFDDKKRDARLLLILSKLTEIGENVIVYCSRKRSTEEYAKKILEDRQEVFHDTSRYQVFLDHLISEFSGDWVVVRALEKGIGIHHGLVPKYIQKEVVRLFNEGFLNVLISTTTITEGVNTSAKNLIVLNSKKADKVLRKFDAKNIAGRAGRFMHHFTGRVIVLQNDFLAIVNSDAVGIKHKNYDLNSVKGEVDLFYTSSEYLTEGDRLRTNEILLAQSSRGLPDYLFDFYKVVSRSDKMLVYDRIIALDEVQLSAIRQVIGYINFRLQLYQQGFQVILEVLRDIIKNEKLLFLVDKKDVSNRYSTLNHFVNFYLRDGFGGSVRYLMSTGRDIDEAIRMSSENVYSLLKYQLVKYLGVFNVMYKYVISVRTNVAFEEVAGIDRLMTKLEYNALSVEARLASDFGVPASIVEYFDNPRENSDMLDRFDGFETEVFDKVRRIIRRE